MPSRHISLGDSDEARKSRFGSKQIVTAGIERALGHLVADREKLARRIQKKTDLHRLEHGFHDIAQPLQPLAERLRGASRAVEGCHERGGACESFIACLGLRRGLVAVASQCADRGLAPRWQIRQRGHRAEEQPHRLVRRRGRDDVGIKRNERRPWQEMRDIISVASNGASQGFCPSQQVRAGVIVSLLGQLTREFGGTIGNGVTSFGRITANVFVTERASVTAGFANDVEAVNQYADAMYAPTAYATFDA